jgi:sulfide:quinone oxidoreductase
MSASKRKRLRVVIAGGGVAALEALLALRALAGQRVDVTLLSPEREFVYRPVTVAEAFEHGEARVYGLGEIVGEQGGGTLVLDSLAEVDAEEHVVITGSGKRLPFDALVVATGAVPRDALPGALTFRGRPDVPALRPA